MTLKKIVNIDKDAQISNLQMQLEQAVQDSQISAEHGQSIDKLNDQIVLKNVRENDCSPGRDFSSSQQRLRSRRHQGGSSCNRPTV